ncbi:16S rRNA (uracil(1498)-N(3))-methyltransferase [Bacillus kwashiorkori]|uniref:16S rRNA (uracil(1498)-N(3))-methyltransferase n=1 Tax=Bacillus kwashiorkori TaxID=1522318 RepID=UPI00078396C1|nr:16S rRNA (uracil(1498)-N(3))-methyltransferase [Bacillus kwashiorkori]
MQRYFVNDAIDENYIQLAGNDYHHITRVMRMTIGDKISVVFSTKEVAICKITKIADDHLLAKVLEKFTEDRELPVNVTIACGLLKGEKFDLVVQKATELGVHKIIPISSERTIVKLDNEKAKKRQERWRKIAKEAAEQSERLVVPSIDVPKSITTFISECEKYDYKLVAYEEAGRTNEKNQFFQTLEKVTKDNSLVLVIGPEGGLSELEVEQLQLAGFLPCGLGPRILRAETAPLYALSAMSFYFELMR